MYTEYAVLCIFKLFTGVRISQYTFFGDAESAQSLKNSNELTKENHSFKIVITK